MLIVFVSFVTNDRVAWPTVESNIHYFRYRPQQAILKIKFWLQASVVTIRQRYYTAFRSSLQNFLGKSHGCDHYRSNLGQWIWRQSLALFSEWAIHRFLYKVSSLKTMQVELFLDESCLNSCELLMIKTKTNFASYCSKEHESWS